MKRITQLTLPNNLNIDVLFDSGRIAYTFEYNKETYGTSVRLPSRKVEDIATACLILFTNAVETYEKLNENNT